MRLSSLRRPSLATPAVLITLALGCGGDSNGPNPPPAQGKTIYAVDLSNTFELFHSGSPETVNRQVAITETASLASIFARRMESSMVWGPTAGCTSWIP